MRGIGIAALMMILAVPAAFARTGDAGTQAAVQKELRGSEFKGIQAAVQDGIVTLTVQVPAGLSAAGRTQPQPKSAAPDRTVPAGVL